MVVVTQIVRLGAQAALALMAVAALAQELPRPVELVNPGFEENKKGYSEQQFEQFGDRVAIDNRVSHGQNASLRIQNPTGSEAPWVAQSVQGLQGGATYSFRAWVRGDGLTSPSLAALKIEFYNAAGENTAGHYERRQVLLSGEWEQLAVTARAPADTTRAALLLRLFGRGTIWFDDLELLLVQEPLPVTLFPERQVVKPGEDRTVHLMARISAGWDSPEPPPLQFRIILPDGNVATPRARLTGTEEGFSTSLELPGTEPGSYRVQCRLEGREDRATVMAFVPLPDRKPTNLSDTGTILADGKPFFPIGLYHVPATAYAELARRGFNCVQGVATGDLEVFGRSLGAAETAQIMVDVPLYAGGQVAKNMAVSESKLVRFSKSRAVLNWKIIDEPDLRADIIDEVPDAYARLRAIDRDHPLSLTISGPDRYAYWASFCDILQVDPYPIPHAPLTLVSDCVAKARGVLEPWQNLTAVLQAGWIAEPSNQPTYEQARVMLYLALVNGAKGIFWYAFRDPGWDLTQTPLWGRFADLNRETAELSQPLMLGTEDKAVTVTCDTEGLQWLVRAHEGKTYVLLANPTDRPLRAIIETQGAVTSASALLGKAPEILEDRVEMNLDPIGAATVVLQMAQEG